MKTQLIKKSDLKLIHDVACTSWKTKLESYASKDLFSNEIELTEEEINEMFEASDEKQTKALLKFFSKAKSITDKIKTFEDACNSLNVNPSDYKTPYEKLCIIIKALNEGWKPNFSNSNENKYYNWFKVENGSFVFVDCFYCSDDVFLHSALYFKNSNLALYCKDTFFYLYKEVYTTV